MYYLREPGVKGHRLLQIQPDEFATQSRMTPAAL